MFGRKKPEVLVVGAGPVGLLAALDLARRDVRVRIIDKRWRLGAHSYALGLHPQTLVLLQRFGLEDAVLERARNVDAMAILDGERRKATLQFNALDSPWPFVAVLQQDTLEDLLLNALEREGVEVLWNHEAVTLETEDDHVRVQIDRLEEESVGYGVAHREWVVSKTRQIEVPFVIGADGHLSNVRRALGVAFDPVGETEHYAVFEFRTHAMLGHEMRLVLNNGSANVLWPLPNGYCRWAFQVDASEALGESPVGDRLTFASDTARFPVLAVDHLRSLLADRVPWFGGSIEDLGWRRLVRFERRLAASFGRGRMWLAGDAGHLAGPIGVHSMNVGLQEAAELAAHVAGILHGGESDERLRSYGEKRLQEWESLLGVNCEIKADAEADPWVREHASALLSRVPATGRDLETLLAQIGLHIAERDAQATDA